MPHVVLLGDSIFDNAAYVPGGPAVIEHLRSLLPRGDQATLAAVDGATTVDLARQVRTIPEDATHLFVSVGGNDALVEAAGLRDEPAPSVLEALDGLADIRDRFERDYRDALGIVLNLGRPTAVCTVYDAIPGLSRGDRAGLCLFNDVILREAARAGLPVIDLRLVCNHPDDYSDVSPIEPSARGGWKIADVVGRVVTDHDFDSGACRVYR